MKTLTSIESTGNKMAARALKLGTKAKHITDKVVLPKVLCVIDDMGDRKVKAALSTGVLHVSTKTLESEGQCRVVSDTSNLGVKATFGSIALMCAELDEAGYAIGSFGSFKAKMFGFESFEVSEVKEVYLTKLRATVKVVEVSNVELTMTNRYTIQQFYPVNRDAIVNSADSCNIKELAKIKTKASTIVQDPIFVEWVLMLRDSLFGGSLVDTLKALVKAGEVKAKPNTTSITASEYDMMALSHGAGTATKWMDSMLYSELNIHKGSEVKRAVEFITEDLSNTFVITAQQFLSAYSNVCIKNGQPFGVAVGTFAKRDFLVDVVNEVFLGEDPQVDWLVVKNGDISIAIPVGPVLYGKFAYTSTIYEKMVMVDGILPKVLKHIAYMADIFNSYADKKAFGAAWFQFCCNVSKELNTELFGKKLGKLKASGLYGVLSPAWWLGADKINEVVFLNTKAYSDDKVVLVAKQPLLFDESLASAKVHGNFPKHLTDDLDGETLSVLKFVFNNTIFCHEEMMLGLQNDADGDLVRLTYHGYQVCPMFSNRNISNDNFSSNWHKAYNAKERGFTGDWGKQVTQTQFNFNDVMDALVEAEKAKANVAIYTNNAHKFLTVSELIGVSKDSVEGRTVGFVLTTFVQEFAMNAIKHKTLNGVMLPDLYLSTPDMDTEEGKAVDAERKELMMKFLVETLKVDMSNFGFESNEDFIEIFGQVMNNVHAMFKIVKPVGRRVLAKDVDLGKDIAYNLRVKEGYNSVQELYNNLNQDIMTDRLLASLIKMI